ncbi:GIY-YIG nuclease family protein [Methylosinus sp. PW1]|uniref:GIY-YIG nuclease family protein n=1 Tax=Methylosinus sp. PW1 TaxID=107636 RepID=UPI0012EB2E9F|nr:GIY-YIG nuclease family protein [Methylosinus sp. PW1]
MATVVCRPRKDGSVAFMAQIFIRKIDGYVRESRTFNSVELANEWVDSRERDLKKIHTSNRDVRHKDISDYKIMNSIDNINAMDSRRKEIDSDIRRKLSLYGSINNEYKIVSTYLIRPSKDGAGISSLSGIYFLWSGDVVVYVGQSKNLNKRLRIGVHERLNMKLMISYLMYDEKELNWAECYYIGILRPRLNFNGTVVASKKRRLLCSDGA